MAIDPATFQEKCLLPVNCLSRRSRRITGEAVANQRMLHPGLLTFMWEVVKGKEREKGGMGANNRDGSSGEMQLRMLEMDDN